MYKKDRKYRPTKLDPNFLVEMSHVQALGDEKHKDSHWKNGVSVAEILDAIKRHIADIERGEFIDPESGVSHPVHIANGAMYLAYYIRNIECYLPFFDLPFADQYSAMADDRVPGQVTPGRVGKILRGSGGAFQEPERSGGTGGSNDPSAGSVPHDGNRSSISHMEQAEHKSE